MSKKDDEKAKAEQEATEVEAEEVIVLGYEPTPVVMPEDGPFPVEGEDVEADEEAEQTDELAGDATSGPAARTVEQPAEARVREAQEASGDPRDTGGGTEAGATQYDAETVDDADDDTEADDDEGRRTRKGNSKT